VVLATALTAWGLLAAAAGREAEARRRTAREERLSEVADEQRAEAEKQRVIKPSRTAS